MLIDSRPKVAEAHAEPQHQEKLMTANPSIHDVFDTMRAKREADPPPDEGADGSKAAADGDATTGDDGKQTEQDKKPDADKVDDKADDAKLDTKVDDALADLPDTRITKRLRKLLADKGASQKAIKERDALIVKLQEQLAAKAAKSDPEPEAADADDDWVEALLGGTKPDSRATEGMTHLEKRLHKMEVLQEVGRIRQQVAAVAKDHPEVPKELLLRAIERDGDADIKLIAEQYDAFVADLRGSTPKNGDAGGADPKPEKKGVTRPQGTPSGSGSTHAPPLKGKSFRSISDVFDALRGSRTA